MITKTLNANSIPVLYGLLRANCIVFELVYYLYGYGFYSADKDMVRNCT